jgi:hypothetical protein
MDAAGDPNRPVFPHSLADLLPVSVSDLFDPRDISHPGKLLQGLVPVPDGKDARNASGEPLSFSCFISLQNEINAYAAKIGKRHFIGLTHKQVMFSHFVAQSAMFWETVFFDINTEKSAEEQTSRLLTMREQAKKIAALTSLTAAFEEAFASGDIVPLLSLFEMHDKKRGLAAWYIAQTITFLALRHEICHVIHGHCALLVELAGDEPGRAVRFNEVGSAHLGIDVALARSLENEADYLSAGFLLNDILEGDDPIIGISDPGFDVMTRVSLATFACCALAVSWNVEVNKGTEDALHPPPLTRALTFLHAFFAVAQRNPEQREAINSAIRRGIQSIFVAGQVIPDFNDLGQVVDVGLYDQERRVLSKYPDAVARRLEALSYHPSE